MNTKIVYAVISTTKDIYFEQAWCSAWSALQHNPTAHLTLVCDEETLAAAQSCYREKGLKLFKEIIPVAMAPDMKNLPRSRWLKTNLRSLVKGDFLFVDSDTVIADDLSEIDEVTSNVAMVIDGHEPNMAIPVFRTYKTAYSEEYSLEYPYYNSGVIYAKDTEQARTLFQKWYDNWARLGAKVGYTDQTPLTRTNIEMGFPIAELPGIWNCQVCNGVRYLHKAKILHIFNHPFFFPTVTHPLQLKETFEKIKEQRELPNEIKTLLLDVKSEFYAFSSPVSIETLQFLNRYLTMYVMYNMWKNSPKWFDFFEKSAMFIYRRLIRFHIIEPFKQFSD